MVDGSVAPDLYLPPNPIVEACATFVTCRLSDLINTSMDACLMNWKSLGTAGSENPSIIDNAKIHCLANARNNCTAAADCFNGGKPQEPCLSRPTCDGTSLRSCSPDGKLTVRFDCASIGEQCFLYENGISADCALSRCTTVGASECRGTQIATCSKEALLQTVRDCGLLGGTCVATTGSARCLLPPCRLGNPPQCQGNVVVWCPEYDLCNPLLPCQQGICGGGQPPPCAGGPACNGPTLSLCWIPGRVSVDCNALGFKACDSAEGGRCLN